MDRLRPDARQAGFTLIEVLVAALIVGLLSAAAATALVGASTATGDQRMRAEADTLASQDQERLRGLSDAQLAALAGNTTAQPSQPFDGTTFEVTSSTEAVSANGQSSCAGQGASDFRISSEVTWPMVGGQATGHITVDSLIARPTTGDLETTVVDQTGAPVSGVTVTAAQQQSDGSFQTEQTASTDTNGCVLFAGLAQGAYRLTYAKTGYVDSSDVSQPSTPSGSLITVTPTGTPNDVQQVYAPAGALTATFATPSSPAAPNGLAGDADAISYLGNGQTTVLHASNTPTSTTTTSLSTTATLYPFTMGTGTPASYANNYAVWAGACSAQKPPTPSLATVQPGPATSSATVVEPDLDLASLTAAGKPVPPTKLWLSFAAAGCTDTWVPPVATGTGTTPPATGWLQDPGQPYAPTSGATLTVCAAYKGTGGVTHYGAATTTNADLAAPTVANLALSPVASC